MLSRSSWISALRSEKVSRNDQLKLSQSRNVSLTPELFPGNKSNISQIAPGICKNIQYSSSVRERIPWSLVSLLFFQERLQVKVRTTTQTWQLETWFNRTKEEEDIHIHTYNVERKRNWKSCSCQERGGWKKSEDPFWNDNGWSIPIVTELNYRSAPANNAANCQSPRVERSMISRRPLKVAGFRDVRNREEVLHVRNSRFFELRCNGFSMPSHLWRKRSRDGSLTNRKVL